MQDTVRVVVAGLDTTMLEKALQSPDMSVISMFENGNGLCRCILALQPDIVVLQAMLCCQDGFSVLNYIKEANMPCPPRIVFLSPFPDPLWKARALALGADEYVEMPVSEEKLQKIVSKIAKVPECAMARFTRERRENIVRDMLDKMHMSKTLNGYTYLIEAIILASYSASIDFPYNKRVYPVLAEKYGCSTACIERCIRHAIEETWLHGDMTQINQMFGLTVSPDRGKPTNNEMISMLAEHTRHQMITEHYLENFIM